MGSPSPPVGAKALPDFFSSLMEASDLRLRSVLAFDLGLEDFRGAGLVAGICDLVLGICSGPKRFSPKTSREICLVCPGASSDETGDSRSTEHGNLCPGRQARHFSMDGTKVFVCATLVRNERPALSENFVASRLLRSAAYAAALF